MAEEKEKELGDEKEEFEKVFAILEKLLLDAGVNIYIWEQLKPTEKVVATLNQYKGFFVHTRAAHVDGFILKVSDVLSNSATAPSFYRILNMLGINSSLAPDINGGEIKKRLRKHKEVLEAIKEWRNKRVAHWDTSVDIFLSERYTGIDFVVIGEEHYNVRSVSRLTVLQKIFLKFFDDFPLIQRLLNLQTNLFFPFFLLFISFLYL